jgi:prephenate dehydrogenase
LKEAQLVTDVGSTKGEIAALASKLFNGPGKARFLPGHPMAGKESGGAALAEAELFAGRLGCLLWRWLGAGWRAEMEWRKWVCGSGRGHAGDGSGSA